MAHALPSVPGVLSPGEVAATAAAIARTQERCGAIPWFSGGQVDPWDHVECAMALLAGGEVEAGERALTWMFDSQRADGTWPIRSRAGAVEDAGADSNMSAYIAVGVWHHWLVRRDPTFLARGWPAVRRALDNVIGLQLGFGGIAWARDAADAVCATALLAGSSSILHSLCCGIELARVVGDPQPQWELAAVRLGHAVRSHEDRFQPKTRFSMDWYYPVLVGAVRGRAGRTRLGERWEDFVVPGLGARCVDDRPWVTGAETCELVLALDTVGEADLARTLLADIAHLREADGSYWTGSVYPDRVRWPVETSTWTAAAVILAADALSRATPGSGIFRETRVPTGAGESTAGCGCDGAEDSAEGITGIAPGADQRAHRADLAVCDEVPALDRA